MSWLYFVLDYLLIIIRILEIVCQCNNKYYIIHYVSYI
jgi:hypothetical protein